MEKRLFLWIGIAVFGGMALQNVLQLHGFSYHMEAGIFTLVAAAVYTGLVLLRKKNRGLTLAITGALGVLSLVMVFMAGTIFPGH
ncbi:hypothetical protein [Jeotgalibacillus proteolyticus]|uniref:Uncharacterized protein n=1 Tax=Jeotgalibacillus proteolyticus TaxID=2082395 RepID=A0A2S5GFY4_9BACL|nr:hypothetical protein [Jeotgalibacillus proteolyticus]PPA71942.1 hypothetical protein C4B60_00765 [Jeotgalibacillus proteolyticus]